MGEGWRVAVSDFSSSWKFLMFDRFLYTLYIAIDGNFKLKGKQRHLKDVELMPGWGAYVPEQEYQSHIANYVNQPEVSVQYGCEKN
jgi:hypothetical protein